MDTLPEGNLRTMTTLICKDSSKYTTEDLASLLVLEVVLV